MLGVRPDRHARPASVIVRMPLAGRGSTGTPSAQHCVALGGAAARRAIGLVPRAVRLRTCWPRAAECCRMLTMASILPCVEPERARKAASPT
jgi:hypothetical protein